MGQDKTLVQLRGVPLIFHALGILRAAGLDPRVAGAGAELSSFAPIIPDDPDLAGLGPLAGIYSALSRSKAGYSVFLPVDLPLIPVSLITYLGYHATITESIVTLVSVAGFIQTFPAVIHPKAATALQASLRSDNRKCLDAFRGAAEIALTYGKELAMQIERLDHLVLTVADVERTCEFYQRVLGLEPITFGEGRRALRFGQQKINLHQVGRLSSLVADRPTAGSGDLCFITLTPLTEVIQHLRDKSVEIIAGPGPRAGAIGTIQSVYFRDPDQNLVEVSNY